MVVTVLVIDVAMLWTGHGASKIYREQKSGRKLQHTNYLTQQTRFSKMFIM